MKKEDYMKLSKERLAELLAERDAYPSGNIPLINDPRPLCGYGGYCTNKFRDCVGCPGIYDASGMRTITKTSISTIKQD